MNSKRNALATILALAAALPAFAQNTLPAPAVAATAQALPPALASAIRAGGLKVEKTFPAISGLTGFVLNRQGEYSIVYATPDNQTIINGVIIGPDGKNMAPVYSEQYIPKPDYDAMWPTLEKAAVVVTGAKGDKVKAVVYAFLDPNCIFCHLAWKAFKPYEQVGLQVRWLPVAFLKPTSASLAAAIMQAEDPTAMLNKHETLYKTGGLAGAAPDQPPVKKGSPANFGSTTDISKVVVSSETRAKLDENSRLMKAFNFNGTPAMVYRDLKSGKVVTKNGMPYLHELPGMFNLPAIPNSDPELARFE
jgi:thiol:disulfide interchange protein DsbG